MKFSLEYWTIRAVLQYGDIACKQAHGASFFNCSSLDGNDSLCFWIWQAELVPACLPFCSFLDRSDMMPIVDCLAHTAEIKFSNLYDCLTGGRKGYSLLSGKRKCKRKEQCVVQPFSTIACFGNDASEGNTSRDIVDWPPQLC